MKSAIITGGTSFIGAGLVDRLLRDGVECYAIVRPESKNFSALPAESSRLHLIRGNASIPEEWKKQVPACDAFFHFAWPIRISKNGMWKWRWIVCGHPRRSDANGLCLPEARQNMASATI